MWDKWVNVYYFIPNEILTHCRSVEQAVCHHSIIKQWEYDASCQFLQLMLPMTRRHLPGKNNTDLRSISETGEAGDTHCHTHPHTPRATILSAQGTGLKVRQGSLRAALSISVSINALIKLHEMLNTLFGFIELLMWTQCLLCLYYSTEHVPIQIVYRDAPFWSF